MKNIFKNRIFIGVICIAVAAIVAFAVLPNIYKTENAKVTVVQAKVNITAGTQITGAMLTFKEIGAFNLPSDVITNPNTIIGKYAIDNIIPTDTLVPTKFATNAPMSVGDDARMAKIGPDQYLLTISVPSASAGVANYLDTGSIINIAYYDARAKAVTVDAEGIEQEGDELPEVLEYQGTTYQRADIAELDQYIVMPEALRGLYIYSVKNSALVDIDAVKRAVDAGTLTTDKADIRPAYLTLIVTEDQAVQMLEIEYRYRMHIIYDIIETNEEAKNPNDSRTPEPVVEPTESTTEEETTIGLW